MAKSKYLKIASYSFIFVLLTAAIAPNKRFFEIAKNIEIYAALFKTVNEFYVDEVNPNQLLNTSVKSMLGELDPYTVYISEDKIEDYRTMSTGQYGGIGASTVRINKRVYISTVVKNGPASIAGIKVGDEVISASGVPVFNKSNEELNQLVRGQAKTSLVLGIRKNGSEDIINISVLRDKITIKNVPYFGILEDNVGYVKFTQFTENGGKNIEKAIKELKKDGATSLIIDLRSNPGGLLHEAVNICNLFIPKDKLVVETKGKRPENSTQFNTLNQPIDLSIPVVVLVNSSSASASEIVAGTLQDYDRAVIVGQKSYGKGLVQNVRPLTYNAQLKVTIAKYYTPSGRCIQALDYTHRNKDGSVGKIADSLKTRYKTAIGRTVYDGGGVDPDIPVTAQKWPPLVVKLIQEGKIYLYANEFRLVNESILAPSNFELSDTQFSNFVEWIGQQEFNFKSKLELDVENIEKQSLKFGSSSELFTSTLKHIKSEVNTPLKAQLYKEKELLKNILEAEIAIRYYDEAGGIETSLANDKEIKIAINLLASPSKYKSILSDIKSTSTK